MADQNQKPELLESIGSISVTEHFANMDLNPAPNQSLAPQHHKWHSTPQALLGAFTVLLILSGLFLSVAHGSLTDIKVAGAPIYANSSQAEIQKAINSRAKNYMVKVKYVDGTVKKYPISAVGINIDVPKSADNAKKVINRSLLKRLAWWQPINIELITKTDKKVADAFVVRSLTQVKQAPVDASLVLDGGTAAITPDKPGSGSTIPKAEQTVVSSVARLNSETLVLKPAILPVAIKAKDLEASKAKAQAMLDKPVVFNIAGHTVTATPTDLAGWLDISPVPKAKTVDVNVNSGKVLQYINSVAKRYITLPRSRLVTNTSQGLVVLDNGANGVDVVDKDKTAASLAQRLAKEDSITVDLAVQYTAAKTVQAQAYDKWFVTDVTNKRMYAYEGTNLVRSFLISAGAPATPTVLGQYKIYAKYASQDMSGNNADGSRYFQPAVPYVNYFTGAYAIHGNYWRPASYFGNINSSHGCVGINVDDAAWIYNWAPIGTAVITHS